MTTPMTVTPHIPLIPIPIGLPHAEDHAHDGTTSGDVGTVTGEPSGQVLTIQGDYDVAMKAGGYDRNGIFHKMEMSPQGRVLCEPAIIEKSGSETAMGWMVVTTFAMIVVILGVVVIKIWKSPW